MANYTQHELEELTRLLETSERTRSLDARRSLILDLYYPAEKFPFFDPALTSHDFSRLTIDHFIQIDDYLYLERLENLLYHSDDVLLDDIQNIHILTSTKGGVGKTLIALSIACIYYFHFYKAENKRDLIGVDLNYMNPDFYRIINDTSIATRGSLGLVQGWQQSNLDHSLMMLRPDDPYLLPLGAAGFWKQLKSILNLPSHMSENIDIVVDTNLNVANIARGHDQIKKLIHEILNYGNRRIYFWSFWTWATFQDLDPITTRLSEMKEFGDRTSVVHVLNPNSLLPPKIDFKSRRKIRQQRDILVNVAAELQGLLGYADSNRIDHAKQEIIRSINDALDSQDDPRLGLDDIPGLFELAIANVVPAISYEEFKRDVASFFRELPEDLPTEQHREIFNGLETRLNGGRPANVFPLATHNPDLTGYTESFARQKPKNMDDIHKKIDLIERDIRFCLLNLQPSLFDHSRH
jgi:hypothetical protein